MVSLPPNDFHLHVAGRLMSLLHLKTSQRPCQTQRQVDECLEGTAAIEQNRRTVTNGSRKPQ